MGLQPCWEITGCGRQKGGDKVGELGECVASRMGFGHSCWGLGGTLCGGAVQGAAAQKEGNCMGCEVYAMYNPITGSRKDEVAAQHPDEYDHYMELLRERIRKETALAS